MAASASSASIEPNKVTHARCCSPASVPTPSSPPRSSVPASSPRLRRSSTRTWPAVSGGEGLRRRCQSRGQSTGRPARAWCSVSELAGVRLDDDGRPPLRPQRPSFPRSLRACPRPSIIPHESSRARAPRVRVRALAEKIGGGGEAQRWRPGVGLYRDTHVDSWRHHSESGGASSRFLESVGEVEYAGGSERDEWAEASDRASGELAPVPNRRLPLNLTPTHPRFRTMSASEPLRWNGRYQQTITLQRRTKG